MLVKSLGGGNGGLSKLFEALVLLDVTDVFLILVPKLLLLGIETLDGKLEVLDLSSSSNLCFSFDLDFLDLGVDAE